MRADREIWVTGIGVVSSLGIELAAHHRLLTEPVTGRALIDAIGFAAYPVHRLAAIDFGRQIPSKSEQRQMGIWQRIGVYASGLALESAGLTGQPDLLDTTDLVVAAGNGERDQVLDQRIFETVSAKSFSDGSLNTCLMTGLRPTLYLGELSNLLAGNIQIIHHVTGSSRTLKGEEMAGVSAIENAVRRIGAGQGDLFLVGGALNAEREDLLLNYELGCNLWAHPFKPVWERREAGGGFVPGSIGAFLVLESRCHAEARGVRPYARIRTVLSDHSQREPGQARDTLAALIDDASPGLAPGPLAVLSGASGVEPVTGEELECLTALSAKGFAPAIRAFGTPFGHSVEAHFPLGVALAALALEKGSFYPPFDDSGVEQAFDGPLDRVLVTGLGHWRGEGLALLERVGAREAA